MQGGVAPPANADQIRKALVPKTGIGQVVDIGDPSPVAPLTDPMCSFMDSSPPPRPPPRS